MGKVLGLGGKRRMAGYGREDFRGKQREGRMVKRIGESKKHGKGRAGGRRGRKRGEMIVGDMVLEGRV